MVEKNALNEFAISFGSVIVLLPNRNSFGKSDLFLELFNVSLMVDQFLLYNFFCCAVNVLK